MTNKTKKSIFKFIILIIAVSILLQWLLPAITSEESQAFIAQLGFFAPLVIIGYTVLSHVFAPVAGSPGVLLGFALFGVVWGSVYLYIASLISAVINFYIARRFGREWVKKLAGKAAMKDVDSFVAKSGRQVLVLCRLFGFPIYEVISYAAGLTTLSFKSYFLITAVVHAIPSLVFVLAFQNTDFTQPSNMLFWLGGLIVIGIVFTALLRKYFLKK